MNSLKDLTLINFIYLTDMKNERNAFWEKAYSELQAHCQSLGLVFEVCAENIFAV